ncbi:MAG: VOC family protein [Paracoccaceae bacterium]
MTIGLFSLSLNVKDIAASKAFYELLGFKAVFGEETQGWLILDNGATKIGLFQGMIKKNTLTFNPGWGPDAAPLTDFEDVRAIQKRLKAADVPIISPADETTTGPANCIISDPDGNPVLLDQHV